MKARQVVILTPVAEPNPVKADSQEEENLRDSRTVFTYNIIKKKNPKVNVVTELITHENIDYMLDDPLLYFILREFKYDCTPIFTGGEIYLSSLMDSLICQSLFNNSLITVLKSLIIGSDTNQNKSKKKNSIDGDFRNVNTSNLYHFGVPAMFVDKKYSKLFNYLTTRLLMIPIGLYRRDVVDLNSFRKETERNEEDLVG